jgi:hypothetical protein
MYDYIQPEEQVKPQKGPKKIGIHRAMCLEGKETEVT